MAYENGKRIQAPEQEEKQRPEKQQISEQGLFSMPNSLMMAMPMTPPPGTPNSVMREMLSDQQIPAAEAEADRLSAGIRSGTPNSIRKEMGRRLGSDFSSVRFHTGPESIRRNEAMGARAYTRGSDVYFGRGGFDPQIGAHELVHTVQQGAIPGHVSQSAAYGAVQMFSFRGLFRRIKNHFRRKKAANAADIQEEDQLIKPVEDPVVEASKPEAEPQDSSVITDAPVEASKPEAEPQDSAAIPDASKDHGVPPVAESDVKEGLKAEGKDEGEVNNTAARFKKMMGDADAQSLMGDAPAASAAAAAEPEVPKAEAPAPNPAYNPRTDTISTTGSSSALAAAAAAAVPEAKAPAPKSPTSLPIPESDDSDTEEEEVSIPADRKEPETIPNWAGSDPEEEPVRLPRGGRYHRRSKGTGTVNEGVSWVNLGNNAVKVLKGVDDLSDYAATGELRWGSRGTHTLSYDQGFEGAAAPYIEGGTSLAGAGTAAISTVTNAMDTVRHAKNIGAGESGADMVQKGLDTAASAGAVLSSGAKFLNTVGAVTPMAEFVPGANIAFGTLRTLSGASQAIRGGIALHRIKKEIKGLQQRRYDRKHPSLYEEDLDSAPLVPDADEPEGTSSSAAVEDEAEAPVAVMDDTRQDDDEAVVGEAPQAAAHADPQEEREKRLWHIFHHGKWISEYNRTAGAMKAGSGALSATSGILTLTGAGAAVGAGLAAANAGLSVGSFAYDKIKKKHIRNRVIASELGITEKAVEDDEALNTAVANTNTQQSTAFGGSRKQIFAQINRRRAKYLLDLAGRDKAPDGSDPDVTAADNVIRALGIHRMKDGCYADGAEELLAEKLGLG